ncbi:30S ribosomal protein S21, partial [Dysosmobacter welbionis]
QYRHLRRLRSGGPFYRGGHLYRLRHQQLRQGLYGNGGLHRDGQPDRPEPDPLCGYLRGHAP